MNYRGYIVKTNPRSPNLVLVVTEGKGGKIPKVLEGSFTSFMAAKIVIDMYLDRPIARRSKNDGSQTDSEGTE